MVEAQLGLEIGKHLEDLAEVPATPGKKQTIGAGPAAGDLRELTAVLELYLPVRMRRELCSVSKVAWFRLRSTIHVNSEGLRLVLSSEMSDVVMIEYDGIQQLEKSN